MFDVQPPPAEYIPCVTPGLELRLPLNRLNVICRQLGITTEKIINGCSIWGYGGFLVIVPKIGMGVTQEDQDAVRKHEEAHGCGWEHPVSGGA